MSKVIYIGKKFILGKCGCKFHEDIENIRGDEGNLRRFINHHHYGKGENHYHWKGGKTKFRGYVLVRSEGHPRAWYRGYYVYEHILVMEEYLDRYLEPDEIVHHINHDREDNRIENLQLMTRSEHIRQHKYGLI